MWNKNKDLSRSEDRPLRKRREKLSKRQRPLPLTSAADQVKVLRQAQRLEDRVEDQQFRIKLPLKRGKQVDLDAMGDDVTDLELALDGVAGEVIIERRKRRAEARRAAILAGDDLNAKYELAHADDKARERHLDAQHDHTVNTELRPLGVSPSREIYDPKDADDPRCLVLTLRDDREYRMQRARERRAELLDRLVGPNRVCPVCNEAKLNTQLTVQHISDFHLFDPTAAGWPAIGTLRECARAAQLTWACVCVTCVRRYLPSRKERIEMAERISPMAGARIERGRQVFGIELNDSGAYRKGDTSKACTTRDSPCPCCGLTMRTCPEGAAWERRHKRRVRRGTCMTQLERAETKHLEREKAGDAKPPRWLRRVKTRDALATGVLKADPRMADGGPMRRYVWLCVRCADKVHDALRACRDEVMAISSPIASPENHNKQGVSQ